MGFCLLLKMAKTIVNNISKNLSGKYSQKRFDHAKQSATDAVKIGPYGDVLRTSVEDVHETSVGEVPWRYIWDHFHVLGTSVGDVFRTLVGDVLRTLAGDVPWHYIKDQMGTSTGRPQNVLGT